LCPRVKVQITEKPVAEEDRLVGVGNLDQIHEDFKALDELGAEHVLLDWYVPSDPTTISDDDRNWRAIRLLSEQVIDIGNGRVR
ncbi:MAG: LLM class F420-dependent oxidoreductase, partial [Chloroflexi bacterium]|nr:LLM class F420-dependent oxidoreductase [Chloroflexota bacterium]